MVVELNTQSNLLLEESILNHSNEQDSQGASIDRPSEDFPAENSDSSLKNAQLPESPPGIRQKQYLELDSPKLSIIDLMMVTTICAITITSITRIGYFGVHAMLLVCLVANMIAATVLVDRPIRFRMWNQFTWGVLMPLVCIFGDPFVFGSFENGRAVYLSQHGIACYVFVGIQLFTLLVSWLVPKHSSALNEFVSGVLFVGCVFSFGVAVILAPLTVVATLAMGIGFPGITPWFTGFVYLRTSALHKARAAKFGKAQGWKRAAGIALPILLALIAFWIAVTLELGFGQPGEGPFEFLVD